MNYLIEGVKITRVMNAVTAGTSDDQYGSILDMAGWDGVVFVASLGTVTSTGVATLKVQQNTANSASGMATLASAAQATITDGSNKLLVVDVHRPREQYVRAQLTRATANVVIDGIVAIQYNGRTAPVTQGSTVADTAQANRPAEA
jgi:hypothetical protein